MKVRSWVFLGTILFAARFGNAEVSSIITKLEPVPPFPAVNAAAHASGIPLTSIDPPASGEILGPGDSVTGLVTLHEKNRHPTQWLIYFEATTNPPTAAMAKPPQPMVVYTSTGDRLEFARSPASIRIRTLGPFLETDPRRRKPAAFGDENSLATVDQDFLGLGMDGGAAAMLRWIEAGRTNFTDSFSVRDKPFDPARIDRDRKLAAQWQITPAEERAVIGWSPALGAYFGTVQETPNLRDMMWKVIDLPSLWSFVRNHGIKVNFEIERTEVGRFDPSRWNFPAAPAYSLPCTLTINGHKALVLTMIVAPAKPPLLTCGGIIGFLAENPAIAENYLTLRIISAHCKASGREPNPPPAAR